MPGEQPAIIERDLFEAVQAKLNEQVNNRNASRSNSEALLLGRIFDDRGNRMTPSHSRKRRLSHRYYVSSALFHGQAEHAGSVRRVPAPEIEPVVIRSIRDHFNQNSAIDDRALIKTHVIRVDVRSNDLVIHLNQPKESEHRPARGRKVLHVPWHKTSAKRRREILVPNHMPTNNARPIRSENRALLVALIARGRRWLNELVSDPTVTVGHIAEREKCSVRKVNMTISLAFLAPDLVKAAIEGRLPHGMGVSRLCDLPSEWPRQYQLLGLATP